MTHLSGHSHAHNLYRLVQDWVHMVWSSRLDGGLSRRRSMSVLDAFTCHKTNDTKVLLHRTNTDLLIIPGRMTWLLQPLDVSINKSFKDGLHRCWSDWIMSGEKTDTKSGRMRKVDFLDRQGVGGDTVRHHQASISEMLHLQQHVRHRGRHHL